jgi:hypothetical protein
MRGVDEERRLPVRRGERIRDRSTQRQDQQQLSHGRWCAPETVKKA